MDDAERIGRMVWSGIMAGFTGACAVAWVAHTVAGMGAQQVAPVPAFIGMPAGLGWLVARRELCRLPTDRRKEASDELRQRFIALPRLPWSEPRTLAAATASAVGIVALYVLVVLPLG